MRKTLLAIPLIALIPLVGACASASATGKAIEPGLAVPPPPPRVIPINPEPVVEPVADVPASPSATPSRPPARPPAPKPSDARSDTKATEAKPPDQPVVEAPPPPPPVTGPPAAAPQLRTAESNGAEGGVRATIDRARLLLNGVDYRQLSNARKKAYDEAKRFAQQAEDALKGGNTVFAQSIAAKAETLAKELAGR
jgi:hypothetical protein